MVTVSSYSRVVESHLQLIHGFQQQTLCLIVKVFKRGLLVKEHKKKKLSMGVAMIHLYKQTKGRLLENPKPLKTIFKKGSTKIPCSSVVSPL